MLACARIGAVHSVVFGGFAAHELATRIDDAKPVMIVSASCGIEPGRVIPYKPLLDAAIAQARHKPRHCIVLQRPQAEAELVPGRDLDWDDAWPAAHPVDCVPVEATDPLYILYTSGTTGQPKGIVRDNGGHATALLWSMRHLYGVEPGEVFWAASDVGWVVGHSYIVYAPLLNGNTTVALRGQAGRHARPRRLLAGHQPAQGAAPLFTAPTAFRAIRKEDPEGTFIGKYDLAGLPHPLPRRRALRSRHAALGRGPARRAGDRPLVADRDRLADRRQPRRHRAAAGQARLADPAGAGLRRPQSSTRQGKEAPDGTDRRASCIKLPLPPGCLPTLWKTDERFEQAYHAAAIPATTSPAMPAIGTRTAMSSSWAAPTTSSTSPAIGSRPGAMEEVLAGHKDVAECAVIGVAGRAQGRAAAGPRRAQGRRRIGPPAEIAARAGRQASATRSARSPPSSSWPS